MTPMTVDPVFPVTDAPSNPGRAASIAGWVVGGLAALGLLAGGVTDVLKLPVAVDGLAHAGFPPHVLVPLGWLTIACAALYLIPQTAVLGGLLLTAYLGGAVATHTRMGDPIGMMVPAVVFTTLLWLGLLLRDRRLRELLPLRR